MCQEMRELKNRASGAVGELEDRGAGKCESEPNPIDRAKSVLHLLRTEGKWCGFLSTKTGHCSVVFCLTLRYVC